jgi:thioredoxin reductase (NADPH)
MPHVDIFIIGAGPIGLSCGIEAQKAGLTYQIVDRGCLVNSLHNFPTDMTFFSSSEKLEIGGIPFSSTSLRPGKLEVLEYYRRIAEQFKLSIGLYEAFESAERLDIESGVNFKVITSKGSYTCDYLVNATGFYDTPLLLNVPGEDLAKVQHYFTSAHHLFQQKVAIIGASNSAIDVALEAYRKGAEVTLLIRGKSIGERVKYWIKPNIEARIKEGSIQVFYEASVHEITPNEIIFKHQGQIKNLKNNFVYAMTGYQPQIQLFEHLGIHLHPETGKPEYDEDTLETNSPSVYLAGVVCGGLNTKGWFIENSRDHGIKIINHIKHHHGIKK